MKYSIAEFVRQTSERNPENNFFDLESAKTLEINLDGSVWMKLGSMVACYGNVTFRRQGLLSADSPFFYHFVSSC